MKSYEVSGAAMLPVQVKIHVNAPTEADALAKAKAIFTLHGHAFVVTNSEDYNALCNWQPFVEELPQ